MPPSTRLTASQSLIPLPLSVSPLSLVSSSASGSAKKYIKTGNLLTLPKPPLIEAEREERLRQEAKATEKRENLLLLKKLQKKMKENTQKRKEALEEWRKEELPTNTGISSEHSRRNAAEHNNLIRGVSDTRKQNISHSHFQALNNSHRSIWGAESIY